MNAGRGAGRAPPRVQIARGVGWLLGPLWIAAMRWRYGRRRRMLTAHERGRLAAHVDASLLDRVRVAHLERIELWTSPAFGRWVQRVVRRRGGRVAMSPAALALGDLVLVTDGCEGSAPLLLHELVHVAQFARLGRAGFAARYLAEWTACGGRVEAIPMELDAYEMQARFERGEHFSLVDEVGRRLRARGARSHRSGGIGGGPSD